MNLEDIKNNLRKFFSGEEMEQGRRLIDRWYHFFDDESMELTDYSDKEKEELRQELWASIEASTDSSEKHKSLPIHRYSPKRISWTAKIAAGFIIVLFAVLPALYYQGMLTSGKEEMKKITYKTSTNPVGEFSRITLSDGSEVWLSAASTLRYPDSFGDSIRTVDLRGEAFFDVVRNPDKPFVVSSGQLQTHVLGTSFNIRGFDNEQDIQVTVATGSVAVRQANDSTDEEDIALLKPDEQLVFDKQTQTGVTQAVKSTLYTSWKDGELIFENHSFAEIARRLERWYGVEIQFTDTTLKEIHFKITFENNSLEHALQMLQTIEDFEFEMEDDQVWIKSSF